jgi:ribosome-associated protein
VIARRTPGPAVLVFSGVVVDKPLMARPFHDEAEHEEALDEINVDENARFADDGPAREAKGEKKRRALQLERLGESLIRLKPGQLSRVPLPDDLRAAVVEAQRILAKKAFGGYRRQVQLVGKIMRTVDAEPIAKALEALKVEGTLASAAFQRAERWRTRLLDETGRAVDVAVDELAAEMTDGAERLDRTALRQLVRAAQKERAIQLTNAQKPSVSQKKLFRLLRELFEPGDAATGHDQDGDHDDFDDDEDNAG